MRNGEAGPKAGLTRCTSTVHESINLTPWDIHTRALDYVCGIDRSWFEDHPGARTYVRKAEPHELCIPGDGCRAWRGTRVRVTLLGPGLRARMAA